MKKLILTLIIFTFMTTSCAYKPRILSGEASKPNINLCIQFTQNTEQRQNIYQIGGGRDDIHNYSKHYYYYYLSDYLSGECLSSENYIEINDAKVGIIFQTYGKGRSYLKLVFNLDAKLYHQNKLILSKTYQTSSKTDVMSFTDGNDKQARLVSKALHRGYKEVINKIERDLN